MIIISPEDEIKRLEHLISLVENHIELIAADLHTRLEMLKAKQAATDKRIGHINDLIDKSIEKRRLSLLRQKQ